jgi:hypothetical protein
MLNSIFLGAAGNYDIHGIRVNFVDNAGDVKVFENSRFGRAANLCLSSTAVKLLTLGYLHLFVHEMGHAFAAQWQGKNPIVNVYTQSCSGETIHSSVNKFTALAGPLAGMTLELIKLIGAIATAILFPPILGIPLGMFVGSGAAFWIFGELMYALVGHGDWDVIRNPIT